MARAGVVLGLAGTIASAGGAPGDDTSMRNRALEGGARLLQSRAPAAALGIHLSGFHPLKDEPGHQMQAEHYCRQVNEDFIQCAIFDGTGSRALLTGVEYVISARLFETLAPQERASWHPHNGEILSGQLVAPGLPRLAEQALMRRLMNSYGKTWHLWDGGDALPVGPPRLAWSFNREGEARPGLVERRDRAQGVDTALRRRQREDLLPLALPQHGVKALDDAFLDARPLPGVVDAAPAR